jgi:signal transduction histidine kinase/PAS domain-containing protein
MIEPSFPENEKERLEALLGYCVLDTSREAEFDGITKLAAQICGKKIGLITLIDAERQWVKSSHGIQLKQTERAISFCAHTINDTQSALIIKNAKIDDRFHDNPLVVGAPFISFYAGVPLVNKDGFALGALCVIDEVPGDITEEQLEALTILGKNTISLLEEKRTNLLLAELSASVLEERNFKDPFFIFLDKSRRVTGYGETLKKAIPEIEIGIGFEKLFIWDNKFNSNDWFRLSGNLKTTEQLFLYNLDHTQKYKFAAFKHSGITRLSMKPIINEQFPLTNYNLEIKDFPEHEYISDFLHFQEISQNAILNYNNVLTQTANEVNNSQKKIEFLSRFPDENPNPVLRFDDHLNLLYFNKAASEVFMSLFLISQEGGIEDLELKMKLIVIVESATERTSFELKQGSFHYQVNSVFSKQNGYLNLYITDVSKFASSLLDQKGFYETILDNFPLDIGVFSKDHVYLYVNKEGIRDKQVRDFMIGKTDYDYCDFRNLPYDLADFRREKFNISRNDKIPQQWQDEFILKDGSVKITQRQFVPIVNDNGEVDYVIGYGVDITELKRIQSEISRQLEFREIISETASAFIGVTAAGLKKIIDDNLEKLGSFLDADRIYFYTYSFDDGLAKLNNEWLNRHISKGNSDTIDISILPDWRMNPHFEGNEVLIQDIDLLTNSEYKIALENLDVKSFFSFPGMVNSECKGFIGVDFTREKKVASYQEIIVLKLFAQIVVNAFEASASTSKIEEMNRLITEMNKDLEERISVKTNENHEMSLMISELDKMATIGEITANIAHDLNTPLGAVKASGESLAFTLEELFMNSIKLCTPVQMEIAFKRMINEMSITVGGFQSLHEMKEWEKILTEQYNYAHHDITELSKGLVKARISRDEVELLQHILNAENKFSFLELLYHVLVLKSFNQTILLSAERASDVIRNLRFYIREGAQNAKEYVNVVDSIETVIRIFEFELKKGIEITLQVHGECILFAVQSKLYQAWSNILKNAIDALDHQGKILIVVKNNTSHVQIRFSNNGPKIPETVLPSIFNKFYTTKDKTKGTGLGLNIVKEIMDELMADIIVHSDDVETYFEFNIPKS